MDEPKKATIRGSVNWVKSFKVEKVEGNPDLLHEELKDLEYLIISQLPYTVSASAKSYAESLERYKEIKCEIVKLKKIIKDLERNNRKNKSKINRQKLYKEIEQYFKKVEYEEPNSENCQSQQEELEYYYDEYLSLTSGKKKNKLNNKELPDADEMQNTLLGLKYDKTKLQLLNKGINFYRDRINNSHYKISGLKKELIIITNNINNQRENCFKSVFIPEPEPIKETLIMPGKKPIKIDHTASTIPKKVAKDKIFSENLVFASLTFILNHGKKLKEISIPVKIPTASVVNLSYFKLAEYMSLEIGPTYNSSNTFLKTQIGYDYKNGAAKNNISLPEDFGNSQSFSHSEQALFFALKSGPVRKLIAKKLREKLAFKNITAIKIKTIVIDLHTSRYMCDHCTISVLGVQHHEALPSLQKLIEQSVKEEMPTIKFFSACRVHTRASASIDFETPKKEWADHNKKITLKNDQISEKDMRIDSDHGSLSINKKKDAILIANDPYLSRQLLKYTLFTSGDTENQKFKTAYARAVYPALNEAAQKIQRAFRNRKK